MLVLLVSLVLRGGVSRMAGCFLSSTFFAVVYDTETCVFPAVATDRSLCLSLRWFDGFYWERRRRR